MTTARIVRLLLLPSSSSRGGGAASTALTATAQRSRRRSVDVLLLAGGGGRSSRGSFSRLFASSSSSSLSSSSSKTTAALTKRETSTTTSGGAKQRRSSSSSPTSSIENTPLGLEINRPLLDGLDVYEIPASGDDHPLTVYGIGRSSSEEEEDDDGGGGDGGEDGGKATTRRKRQKKRRKPILLLHGRTWSSVPVYHLAPQGRRRSTTETTTTATAAAESSSSRSLMEALLDLGLDPYALDFRGFGGTASDATGCVEPNRCVEDAETALRWIAEREEEGKEGGEEEPTTTTEKPALLGWSQGALIAQLVAQKSPSVLSKLVLYGSIYDPLVRYPRSPLYASSSSPDSSSSSGPPPPPCRPPNTFDSAIEDFTVEGSIPPEPARQFAQEALAVDPYKAIWRKTDQFNNCDPGRVHVPTLVVAGDQDPYAPLRVQSDLFCHLGRGADRTWSIVSGADHAVHLLDEGKTKFARIVANFVEN